MFQNGIDIPDGILKIRNVYLAFEKPIYILSIVMPQ
jgi:hypothetical protein